MQKIDFPALMQLAQASEAVTAPCSCIAVPLTAWQAQPLTLDLERFEDIGTLMLDPYDEPTFAEYHPAGTRAYSDDAPIAPLFYPYNRCTVARCTQCSRVYLRYNEAGGYFTELRIRALQPGLLVNPAVA
ncbi:MAG TPA: hypothetical protein VF663_07605 [Telluria sp.]